MRRLTTLLFIFLLVFCDLSVFAQRGGGYRPPPTYRPPVRSGGGGFNSGVVRPTIPRITRPPRSLDPARRQPIPGRPANPAGGRAATNRTTTNRAGTSGSTSVKPVTIPAPKSPTVVSARVAAKPKLDQLRASLRARLRSSTALSSTIRTPGSGRLAKSGSTSEKSLNNLLMPKGQLVGIVKKGATQNIRTVTKSEFQSIESGLMGMGAKQVAVPRGYRGKWYELPNGQGRFGIRNSEKSGKTIDLDIEGYEKGLKLHQQ
jgi:hypothetical protein